MARCISLCVAATLLTGVAAGGVSASGSAHAVAEALGGICDGGVLQSPISIESCHHIHGFPLIRKEMGISYSSTATKIANKDQTLIFTPDKSANTDPHMNSMSIPGYGTFYLDSCVMKMPSDHQINHNPYPMEIQCKHEMEGSKKRKGMLSILYEEGHPTEACKTEDGGKCSPVSAFLSQFTEQTTTVGLPKPNTGLIGSYPNTYMGSVVGKAGMTRYYTYVGSQIGSKADPDCSENAIWVVMMDPVSLSAEQLKEFNQSMTTKDGYLGWQKTRHVQDLNGRIVEGCQSSAKTFSASLSALVLVATAFFARS